MKLSNELHLRDKRKKNVSNTIGINNTYVPPESDIQTWSVDKMIECWTKKDKQCFWDNLLWVLENKQEKKEYTVEFKNPFQPDKQGEIGSATRCVASDTPKYLGTTAGRVILNWVRNNTIGGVEDPNDDPYFHCSNLGIGGGQMIRDACELKCNRLKQGEICAERDVANMGFEQSGCDGSEAYCWCNSSNQFKK
jgi:hypothetical protein